MTTFRVTSPGQSGERDLQVLSFMETPEEVHENRGVFHELGARDPVVVTGESTIVPAHGYVKFDTRKMEDWEWLTDRMNERSVLSVELTEYPIRLVSVEDRDTEDTDDGGLTTVAEVYKWVAVSTS